MNAGSLRLQLLNLAANILWRGTPPPCPILTGGAQEVQGVRGLWTSGGLPLLTQGGASNVITDLGGIVVGDQQGGAAALFGEGVTGRASL